MSAHQGSAIQYQVHEQLDLALQMRDGVGLATDVYLPALGGAPARGPFPVLLERTPYDKRRPVLVQAARYFARRGYAVVLQDVRGRFRSGGEWYFRAAVEGPDGSDAMAWVHSQPWCSGKIGTMGLSYTAANQQALALEHPPGLAAQFLCDGGYNYFHRTLRNSGAMELGVLLPYAFRMARFGGRELAADPVARSAFERAWDDMRQWLGRLPLREGDSPLTLAPSYERWFMDMQTTADYTDFWKHPGVNLQQHVDRYPDVPVYMQTSWYGHHVWATTERFNAFRERLRSPVRLLIGHWTHGYDDYARSWCGEVDFGMDAMLDSLNDLRLGWFDHWLKGLDTGVLEEPPVRIFVMGGGDGRRDADGRMRHGGRWRDEQEWPLARTDFQRWYLHPGGGLHRRAPAEGAAASRYTFDPRDPVPTVGGNTQNPMLPALLQGGAFDQRGRTDLWVCRDTLPLASRTDVLAFRSEPLEHDLEVTGPISVRLWVASSAPDTDFTAKLVDEHPPNPDYPDGFAMNLADGILRLRYRNGFEAGEALTPGEVYAITIEPQATSNLFRAGHRIRIDVSSSNFPHFDVNPNTGGPLGVEREYRIAHQSVFHDAARASHVVLPVIPG
jgi:putative CocE/NonD family hydrolase